MGVSQTVREMDECFAHLSADVQACICAAAVLGERFALPLLTRILNGLGGSPRVIELLDEAQGAGLVVRDADTLGDFRFTDADTRSALYGILTNAERARLHGAAARAIEELYAGALEPHFAQLAHHCAQAGTDAYAAQAVDYALKAAARFNGLHQHEDALGAYELARTVLLRSAPDPARHCEILLGLACAQQRAGHKMEARANFEEAATLARRLGAPGLLARAAVGYGAARSWDETGVVNHTLLSLLKDSLRCLPASRRGLRACVQARLAEEMYHRPPDERRALIRQALAAARRARDPAVLAQVLLSRRFALWAPENLEQRRDDASEAVALARQARDLELEANGIGWLINDLLELGLVREADLQIQTFAKLVEQLKQPLLRRNELGLRSMRAAMLGRFDDAERLATEGLQIGAALEDTDAPLLFGAQLFALRRLQGRLEEVEPTARAFSESLQNVWMWKVALASIAAELGRATDAQHEFDFLARNDFTDLFRDAHWLTAVALLAEACAFLRDSSRAAILYELLAPFATRHVIAVPGIASAGSASYYLGLLASTMGQWPVAIRHFEAALKMNKTMQAVPHVAQTEHAFAAALLGRNQGTDAKRAAKLLASAIATYERLGMRAHLARARALADAKSAPRAASTDSNVPAFILDGESWSLTWRNKTVKLKHVRGLSVIAHLVSHSRRRFHVTELAPVADGVARIAEATSVRKLSTQQRASLRWQSFWRERHRLEWEAANAERRGDRVGVRAFRRKLMLMKKQLDQAAGAAASFPAARGYGTRILALRYARRYSSFQNGGSRLISTYSTPVTKVPAITSA